MIGHVKLLSPPSLDEPPQAVSASPSANALNTIEQVRELLYGDAMRHQGRRVEDIGEEMRDLEQRILQRFDDMQTSMDALTRTLRLEQATSIRNIGLAIAEVGRQIASMGDVRDRAGSDAKS